MSSAAKHSQAVDPKKRSASSYDHDNIELEDRLVAEQFIQSVRNKLEKKDRAQSKGDEMDTKSDPADSEKPDLRPLKTATTENGLECEDYNVYKLPERGIHSLTNSVTDELSGPTSEVEDDPRVDPTDFSFTTWVPPSEEEVGREPFEESIRLSGPDDDDFEGANGEIDSLSGEHFIELSGARLVPNGKQKRIERNEEEEKEDGVVIQASDEVQDGRQQSTKAKLDPLSGHRYSQKSDSEEFSSNREKLEVKKIPCVDTELDDTASNLETISSHAREEADEPALQPRLDSEISLLYPQPLEPEDVINPFSLEVRIRKAREQQDIALEWEAETIAENVAGISQPQLNLEETIRSTLPVLEEVSPDQATGSSQRAVENGFASHVKERVRTERTSKEDCKEDCKEHAKELSMNQPGAGEAVLLGALASGVNSPTWFVIRAVLVGLVASLLMLIPVAIKSGSWFLLLNVLFFMALAVGLIILLRWYISEIGLVSVDQQMEELNLTSDPNKVESKTL